MECPGTEDVLEEALRAADNHVLVENDKAVAWIGITESNHGSLLDIAVHPEFHGKWLTRDVISRAGDFIFDGREFVILENSKGNALKFALRMGAKPFMIPGKKDTYLLSKASFNGRAN